MRLSRPSPAPRFVLFAHPRSGSSVLSTMLGLHPRVRMAEEPFHERYRDWRPDEPTYVEAIRDIPSLDTQLAAIYAKYDGMKVLDSQLPRPLYTHLLLRPDLRVIFLERRNLLRTVVSLFIAKQTKVWNVWDVQGDLRSSYADLAPLPIETIGEELDYVRDLRVYYRSVAMKKPADMRLFVDYEDLYTEDMGHNRRSLDRVFRFLGLRAPEPAVIDEFLDPRSARINSDETYALVPNAREIEARFGNDTVGWLFGTREASARARRPPARTP